MEQTSDMQYVAIEPRYDRLRLAHDAYNNIFIVGSPIFPFSAPYDIALAGFLYDNNMDVHMINEWEYHWIRGLRDLVNQLSFQEGNP